MVGDSEVAVSSDVDAMAMDEGIAVTFLGRASVGAGGAAIGMTGHCKGVSGGPGALLAYRYWDGKNHIWAFAVVGSPGFAPGVDYRVEDGKWVLA